MGEMIPLDTGLADRLATASSDALRFIAGGLRTVLSVRATVAARGRVASAIGLEAMPGASWGAGGRGGCDCLWVRPDEWLVVAPVGDRESLLAELATAVGPNDGAVVDISASRVAIDVIGPRSRDVLAACCPLDLHPRVFAVGQCAQSLVGRAPVLVQRLAGEDAWRVYVRPSLAGHVVSWFTDAAASAGQA